MLADFYSLPLHTQFTSITSASDCLIQGGRTISPLLPFSSSASYPPSFGFNPWTRLHFQPIKFVLVPQPVLVSTSAARISSSKQSLIFGGGGDVLFFSIRSSVVPRSLRCNKDRELLNSVSRAPHLIVFGVWATRRWIPKFVLTEANARNYNKYTSIVLAGRLLPSMNEWIQNATWSDIVGCY